MLTLSAFGDEISPDPVEQVELLCACGIGCIELRAVNGVNLLDLSDMQVRELKSLLDGHGLAVSAVASPVGKAGIDQPFALQRAQFARALELCQRFGTHNVRVFSYSLPEGGEWDNWRRDVLDRLWEIIALAGKAGVRVLHENERGIYGDSPERVRDLMETIVEQVEEGSFATVFDPANYVVCGHDPWLAWEMTRSWVAHFHVKDWVRGQSKACLPGTGEGRLREVLADATAREFDGFATLEPHLLTGGVAGGFTGTELFLRAVAALRQVLDQAGASYR